MPDMEQFDDTSTVEAVATRVQPVWEQVIEDMAATAEAYRDEGWEATECHPGDVAAVGPADAEREDARTGLDLVVPDDEFERVATAVDGPGAFNEVEVFRATQNEIVFFTAALENDAAETVVLVPAYYDLQHSESFLQSIQQEGELRIHVRPVDQRRVITFTQSDPEPFLPEES
jgi:hypothetical protein